MVKESYYLENPSRVENSAKQSAVLEMNNKVTNGSESNGTGAQPTDISNVSVAVLNGNAKQSTPDSENGTENEGEKLQPVSFLQMFRYSDGLDRFLLFIGTLAAIGNGLAIPVNFLLYGDVASGFIYYTQYKQIQQTMQAANNTAGNISLSMIQMVQELEEYSDLYGRTQDYALYFCLVGISVIVFGTIQYTCWGIATERQIRKIKQLFFRAVLHQDIGWFDVHNTGTLAASFNESMHGLHTGLGRETSVFLQWLFTCLGAYTVALFKGWKLALACLTFGPVVMLVGAVLMWVVRNVAAKEAKAYSSAGSVAEESLSSIKTVMAFNGQKKESQRYNKCLGKASDSSTSKGLAVGTGMGFIWLLMFSVFCLAFWYANKLTKENEPNFDSGSVLTIIFGVMLGSMSLGQAFPILETIGVGRAAAAKIYSVIAQNPTIHQSPAKGDKPASFEGTIEFRQVSFTYPARPDIQVLKSLSFQVQKGQTVALVGSSGSGKSTVVQLVERFYDADEGQVLLDGRDVKTLDINWLRQQIGLVSQEPVLFGTTIAENIHYGRLGVTTEEIKQAAIKANAHDFISALPKGYETLVGDRGAQLSGGQKQRIAIARALVRDPRILLLDEATSALDNESEAVVQNALEKAQEGRTTLVIAHRLSTIRNADLIIVMKDGEFVEEGKHAELMERKGLYHNLVEHQLQTSVTDTVAEELEHDILDVNEAGHDESSPLTVQRKLEKSLSVTSQIEEGQESEDLPEFSMRRILRLNAPEWYLIVIGCLFSVIVGSIQPSLAYILSEFLTIFTDQEGSDEKVYILIAVAMGIGVGNTLLRVILALCFARAGANLTQRIRLLTFDSMLKQDMSFYDDPKHRVGVLTTRLSSDATILQGATGSKIGVMLESVTTIVAAIVVAMVSSWQLALAILAFMPLMVGGGIMHGKLMTGFSRSDKNSVEQAGQIVSESIDNIRLLQALSQEETFQTKYDTLINGICSRALKRTTFLSFLLSFSTSVMFFSYAASLTYGAYLVMYDDLDFQMVFRAFTAIIFGGMMVGRNSTIAPDFTKAKMACRRLFSLIDTVPKIDISSDEGKVLEKCTGEVKFQNLNFQYPARPEVTVLQDLSFSVLPGETVALVGTSGCGKSTTVSLIERFYDPMSGVVHVDKEDVRDLNLKWLRSQIGFVGQEPVLFDCSIAENIAYGDNSRVIPMEEIIQSARSANIHSFITSLPDGYNTNVGSKGTQLSGGQKQRVAIARALISNPNILLLDEATSALDSQSEKIVQEALDHAREGRTCIVIAHRLSTIHNADKIVIFHKGAIVESGTHAELMAMKQVYFKLHQAQHRKKKD